MAAHGSVPSTPISAPEAILRNGKPLIWTPSLPEIEDDTPFLDVVHDLSVYVVYICTAVAWRLTPR
jgi:hypothetical protein